MVKDLLKEEVQGVYHQMCSFLHEDKNGNIFLEDPVEEMRIPAHYGETHLCAAMLVHIVQNGEDSMLTDALRLFDGIVNHWENDRCTASYHSDFNNFALSIILNQLTKLNESKRSDIAKKLLIASPDSKNHTVNWLPMRAYVDLTRYEITGNEKYISDAANLLAQVEEARYADGMFDDLMPKGKSFNLQYSISTAAEIQLVYNHFKSIRNRLPIIDTEKSAQTMYQLVLPDGDINYMGRGCNQLFAWGPWFYLCENYINEEYLLKTLFFFKPKYETASCGYNLFLNEYNGKDKVLWWDYHYYSVYASHFLLWYELACSVKENKSIEVNQVSSEFSCGLRTVHNDDFFIVTFTGREHYLIEKGPSVVAAWNKDIGSFFKCGHAPAEGRFSDLYFNPIAAYLNHFGLVDISESRRNSGNRIIRKVKEHIRTDNSLTITPSFSVKQVRLDDSNKAIEYYVCEGTAGRFVLPIIHSSGYKGVKVKADGTEVSMTKIATIPSQYGDVDIIISPEKRSMVWTIIIE